MAEESQVDGRLTLFISYSRADLPIAEAIVSDLERNGFRILIDRRDLPYGEEWQPQLADMIRASDTVVWLVSPTSISSKWCNWELGEVGRVNKRLVPVRIRDIALDALPEALGKIQILPADGVFDAAQQLPLLVNTLNTNQRWLKEATRLFDRAAEWIANNRNSGLLLRSAALVAAEAWSAQRPAAAPAPASEVFELILASRQGQTRRLRWAFGISAVVAVAAAALATIALVARQDAARERDAAVVSEQHAKANQQRAEKNEALAIERRDQTLIAQSRFLATRASDAANRYDYGEAIATALESLPAKIATPSRPFVAEAAKTLWEILRRFPAKAVLREHRSPLLTAAFSPDGSQVVTGGNDGARLWNTETGHRDAVLEDKSMGWQKAGTIGSIAYSRDGGLIATASWRGSVWIWDAKGKLITTLSGHLSRTWTVVFSKSGDQVLTASDDGTARIWNVGGGKEVLRKTVAGKTVSSAVFAPDDQSFATASEFIPPGGSIVKPEVNQGKAQIWNSETGTEIATYKSKSGMCREVAFSPDGKLLAVNEGSEVAVWDIEQKREVARLGGHEDIITAMAFSADQKFFTTSSQNGTTLIWEIASPWAKLREINGQKAGFSPDGKKLITLSAFLPNFDSTVWDVQSGRKLQVLRGHSMPVAKAAYSHDGRRIVTASEDNSARIWNADGGALSNVFNIFQAYDEPPGPFFGDVRFVDGGRKIVTQSAARSRLWEADTGRAISVLPNETFSPTFSFSEDGNKVISSKYDGTATLRDIKGGDVKASFPGKGKSVYLNGAVISGDGAHVATWYSDGATRLWDVKEQKQLAEIAGTGPVWRVIFLRDGRLLIVYYSGAVSIANGDGSGKPLISEAAYKRLRSFASSADARRVIAVSDERTVEIRDTTAAHPPIVKDGGKYFLLSVAMSADGKYAAIGSQDQIARVYNAETGDEVAEMKGHQGWVTALRFSTDGKHLVTASQDGTARIWDTETGTQLMLLPARDRGLTSIAISEDGRQLATATDSGDVQFLRLLDDQSLVDEAKSIAPQCLPQSARVQLGLESADFPEWCVTGHKDEDVKNPAQWKPLPPYRTPAWKDWLIARRSGDSTAAMPPE